MKLIKKSVTINDTKYTFFSPKFETNTINPVFQKNGIFIYLNTLVSNLISQLLLFSKRFQNNTFIHIKNNFIPNDEFREIFYQDFNENSLDIIIVNYHKLKLKPKDIIDIVNSKNFTTSSVKIREIENIKNSNEYWKLEKKLTVKKHGKFLFLFGNNDIFNYMAYNLNRFTYPELFDEGNINSNLRDHIHFDSYENTYKSLGVTFYYWQNINLTFKTYENSESNRKKLGGLTFDLFRGNANISNNCFISESNLLIKEDDFFFVEYFIYKVIKEYSNFGHWGVTLVDKDTWHQIYELINNFIFELKNNNFNEFFEILKFIRQTPETIGIDLKNKNQVEIFINILESFYNEINIWIIDTFRTNEIFSICGI